MRLLDHESGCVRIVRIQDRSRPYRSSNSQDQARVSVYARRLVALACSSGWTVPRKIQEVAY